MGEGMRVLEREPMNRHTSFRIGGPVRAMVFPRNAEELRDVLRGCEREGLEWFLLGRGSNLLCADGPIDKIAVHTGEMRSVTAENDTLTAEAGAPLAKIAVLAQERGLSGLEFAHGIPGTLGGAVLMNAGAYGGEMKDVIVFVTALSGAYENAECGFSYRHSRFEGDAVLSAAFRLRPGDPEEIRARMEELMARRREKQPLDLPSAGSTFKRPEGHFAAKLIEDCGLKGYAVGGAQVSEKHAGFVVNRGNATFDDVRRLMDHIRETVLRETGVLLEPEVKIIQ